MAIKIAINGFGRIGRAAFKVAQKTPGVEIVALNDLTDNETLAHLLQYDTVYGQYPDKIIGSKEGIKINGRLIPVFEEKEPLKLPWSKLNVDVVLECTGKFTDQAAASQHLKAGAKRVIISAPAKDEVTQTLVYGTKNTATCLKTRKCQKIISMASCTTNCIAPIMQVLESRFGIEKAMMTTVHSYTADQNLIDGPHRDLRRARSAACNIVPTTTGAAIATTKVIPSLKNAFDGTSIRVPTICVSLSDITAVLKRRSVTIEQINEEFIKAAKDPLFKKVLSVSSKPLVSSDFIGNPYSTIVDLEYTNVVGGNLIKVLAWYDNEWGYSSRLVQMAQEIGKIANK